MKSLSADITPPRARYGTQLIPQPAENESTIETKTASGLQTRPFADGAGCGVRTHDLLFTRQLLYQLS